MSTYLTYKTSIEIATIHFEAQSFFVRWCLDQHLFLHYENFWSCMGTQTFNVFYLVILNYLPVSYRQLAYVPEGLPSVGRHNCTLALLSVVIATEPASRLRYPDFRNNLALTALHLYSSLLACSYNLNCIYSSFIKLSLRLFCNTPFKIIILDFVHRPSLIRFRNKFCFRLQVTMTRRKTYSVGILSMELLSNGGSWFEACEKV
jgi:hypothetical protein